MATFDSGLPTLSTVRSLGADAERHLEATPLLSSSVAGRATRR